MKGEGLASSDTRETYIQSSYLQMAEEVAGLLTERKGFAPAVGIMRECTLDVWAEVHLLKTLFAEIAVR